MDWNFDHQCTADSSGSSKPEYFGQHVNDNSRPSDDYIVIGAFASGDPILCKKAEETISIYNQEVGEIDEELVYPDFVAFLNDLYELLGIGE